MSSPPEGAAKANRGPAAGPENRRALIAAARQIFREQGLGAPLSAVARLAGVGQGSLYRHFPDRLALATAVFEENVAGLEVFVEPAEVTLEDLFDRIVAQALVSGAFIELTTANRHDPDVRHLGGRFREVIVRLLDRERAAGRIGEHVEVDDVLLMTGMLATELARTDPADREAVAVRIRSLLRRALTPWGQTSAERSVAAGVRSSAGSRTAKSPAGEFAAKVSALSHAWLIEGYGCRER